MARRIKVGLLSVIVLFVVLLILTAFQTKNKTTTTELPKPSAQNDTTANGYTKKW